LIFSGTKFRLINNKFSMQGPAIVPDNETGASSDNEHSVQKQDEGSAKQLFELAKGRLLDVNNWHSLSGGASATFQLTDEKGNAVHRPAQLGDHFKIDIPGPGTITGKGSDWVQVEAIEQHSDENEDIVAIRVRPVTNPQNTKEDVAHFFTDDASSTFSVRRKGNIIVAAVQGRNEKPNISAENLIDKLRNAVIGATAIAGMNKPQWKSLVKGLLSE
jgi:hypothetical protein